MPIDVITRNRLTTASTHSNLTIAGTTHRLDNTLNNLPAREISNNSSLKPAKEAWNLCITIVVTKSNVDDLQAINKTHR